MDRELLFSVTKKDLKINFFAASPAFKTWLADKIAGLDIEGIRRKIEEAMCSEDLKVECIKHGIWEPFDI